MFKPVISLAAIFVLSVIYAQSQCIVINEIMINGAGPNDGQNSPYTEEWIELYNACSTPVDIGCFVLADGDFTITIPAGTVIPASGYYTLGSVNAGFPVDLDWATCGCTGGSTIGIFTNGNEQLVLVNSSAQLQDAIYWGGGQFPVNNSSASIPGCSSLSVNYSNPDGNFEQIGSGGGQGCALARSCDGGTTWQQRCGATITPDATNSQESVTVSFAAGATTLCPGECIAFTDLSSVSPNGWNWSFEGSTTASSTNENPLNICYDVPGEYDVTLQITTGCGTYTQTLTDYIEVTDAALPEITATGPVEFCEGGSVLLETTATGDFQWNFNDDPIAGETGATLEAAESGAYSVTVTNGTCSATSDPVIITIAQALEVQVIPEGPTDICENSEVILAVPAGYDSYQWLLDGNEIIGATGNEFPAGEPGDYNVEVSDDDCPGVSDVINVTVVANPEADIDQGTSIELCAGETIELTTQPGFATYQWLLDGEELVGAETSTFTATTAGTYAVNVTVDGGCSTTASSTVSFVSITIPVIESSTGSFTACAGETLILTAGSESGCEWYQDEELVDNGGDPALVVTEGGIYYVEVISGNCNAVSEEVWVEFVSLPVVSILPDEDVTMCDDAVQLTATSTGSFQWLWNGDVIPGATSASYVATANGAYSFISAIDGDCPVQSIEITVTLIPGLDVQIQADNSAPCEGEEVGLSISGDYDTISWSTGDDSETIEVSSSDTYTVTVTGDGCTSTDELQVTFSPIPYADAGQDTITECDVIVMLSGTGTGSLEWLPDPTISDPSNAITSAVPFETTTYTLVATLGNCTVTDDITIEVDCGSVFIPNVFTPNGDGKNDVFEIQVRGVSTFELKIYNRWGDVVFETTNPQQYWTGGKHDYFVPDGTYYWTIVALDARERSVIEEEHTHGHVTVLR